MEEQMTEILSYLRHTNPEVKKQALAAVFQYSEHPEVVEFIRKSEMMKAIKACLYDLKMVHSTLLVLLNLSADKGIVTKMIECQIMDSLLQIIFNVMKTMNKDDLMIKKHLMIDIGSTKIGADGSVIREMKVNTGAQIPEDDIVTVMNLENLRTSLMIINNICTQSLDGKKQLLQFDADEKTKGTHFIVLLGWFLIDEYELLFENFAPLMNALTEVDELKDFLLNPTIRLESRIKRYLLHSNHVIRGSMLQCMKHLFFSHENLDLTKRFIDFKEDEVHILELNSRCLYLAMLEKYEISEAHQKSIEKYLGTVWKPIKTLKKVNPRMQTVDEEIEHALDIFLVSINFDFATHFEGELKDQEPVLQMYKVLALYADYSKEVFLRDKVTAIISVYTGDIII